MRKLLYVLLISICFGACDTSSEDVAPSYKDRDWFVIVDDPDHVLNHTIYELYEKWNVPVFYNDTIGQDTLYLDAEGNPVIHHEMLHTRYSITTSDNYLEYSLADGEADMLRAIRLLDEEVLPMLPKSVIPRSYLLVDTVLKYAATYKDPVTKQWGRNGIAYRTLNTTFIGQIESIDAQTPGELKRYCAEIIAEEVAHILVYKYNLELQPFYNVSRGVYESVTGLVHGVQIGQHPINYPYKSKEALGFLDCSNSVAPPTSETTQYKSPTELEDVQMYVIAFYQYSEEEFIALYGTNSLYLSKYNLIKGLVSKL